MKKICKQTELAMVENKVLCDKLINMFANMGIVTYFVASQISDCKMEYLIKTDQKLTARRLQQIEWCVYGFVACFNSY